jgi:tRNA/rRNA methyltransferase
MPEPAARHPSTAPAADPTRFVLVQPSHAGNVGAAARAMKVMGFTDLVLVQPRFPDVLNREETLAMASGATDILLRARVVHTLQEALAGVTWACATAMTPRDFGPPTSTPREHFASLAGTGHIVGLVFGPERTGLSNEDVYRCHACLSIPTHPDYGSLNLAQAVQLLAYDWRQAWAALPSRGAHAGCRTGRRRSTGRPAAHWEQTLVQIGFLDAQAPRKLMPRLNQLLNRAQLTQEEVHILRGMARAAASPRRQRD